MEDLEDIYVINYGRIYEDDLEEEEFIESFNSFLDPDFPDYIVPRLE